MEKYEKQDLTLDELEAQAAVELPERDLMCYCWVTQTTTVRNTNNNTNTATASGITLNITL